MAKQYDYIIGIDPGVNTGFAVWDMANKSLKEVSTTTILKAIQDALYMHEFIGAVFVRVEDARLRKWFGNAGREQLQGAGSIKRDCQIWQEFLEHHNVPHEFVAPKNNKTKLSPEAFKKLTGWKGKCSIHARDAAMLCFGK